MTKAKRMDRIIDTLSELEGIINRIFKDTFIFIVSGNIASLPFDIFWFCHYDLRWSFLDVNSNRITTTRFATKTFINLNIIYNPDKKFDI